MQSLFTHENWSKISLVSKLTDLAARRKLEDLTVDHVRTHMHEQVGEELPNYLVWWFRLGVEPVASRQGTILMIVVSWVAVLGASELFSHGSRVRNLTRGSWWLPNEKTGLIIHNYRFPQPNKTLFPKLKVIAGAKMVNYKTWQQHLIDKHKFPASFEFIRAFVIVGGMIQTCRESNL